MNTISKGLALGLLLLLSSCVQGPWSFWPENPTPFRGIWVTGNLVAGWPLRAVCFEALLSLEHASSPAFAFYDSAKVQVQGRFSGQDTLLTLHAQANAPNCFDAPQDLLPEAGQSYRLLAQIDWDSSGSSVRTRLESSTKIPLHFAFRTGRVLGLARPELVLSNEQLAPRLRQALGNETYEFLRNQPQSLDSALAANLSSWAPILLTSSVPFQSGDSLLYMDPPFDLRSHQFPTEYSDDVEGVQMTIRYPHATGKGSSSFDGLFGEPDSSSQFDPGSSHRLAYISQIYINATQSYTLDTLGLSNAYLYIGYSTLYGFATGKEYATYVQTAIQGADDSRIRPVGNIQGGQGIFAGMLVDSLIFHTRTLPGSIYWPYARTSVLYCRALGFSQSKECRKLLPRFCSDSLSVSPECYPQAVAQALDSNLAWNALLPALSPVESDSTRLEGERLWCLQSQFPADSRCQGPRAELLEGNSKTSSLQEFWDYCADRSWPLQSLPICGEALVSYVRLESIRSVPLQREAKNWCLTHPQSKQCLY